MLIAAMGPTASGKSAVAEHVARELDYQLINADAFMVYRGLDVGTNKPQNKQDYELIDLIEPQKEFGVGEWVLRAVEVLERLWRQDRGAVIVGGTGFYVRALMEEYQDLHGYPDPELRATLTKRLQKEGLDALAVELQKTSPETAASTDLHNPVRVTRALERVLQRSEPIQFSLPPYKKAKFVLEPPPAALDEAIAARVGAMFDAGWADEVEGLLRQGVARDASGLRAIGYDSVIGVVEGRLSSEEARLKIATETRQYAKRQRTWLRSEPNAVRIPMEDISDKILRETATSIIDFVNSMEHQNG